MIITIIIAIIIMIRRGKKKKKKEKTKEKTNAHLAVMRRQAVSVLYHSASGAAPVDKEPFIFINRPPATPLGFAICYDSVCWVAGL